jgi:D-sedoheptulose 7-phosphate isomerase
LILNLNVTVLKLYILQMNTAENFKNYFNRLKDTLNNLNLDAIEKIVDALLKCREDGRTMFIFGNGGSAANASHIAGDFLKGISYGMEKRFKVLSLVDNIAGTTAITNDLSYDEVFIEQLRTFLVPGDVVIGISGSGNSENVVKALKWAADNGGKTIAMVGYKGGRLADIAEIVVHAPVNDMEITEDVHAIIFHSIKQEINRRIKGDNYSMGEKYDKRINL